MAVLLLDGVVRDTLFLLFANVLLTVSWTTLQNENVPANVLIAGLPTIKEDMR
jgi:hypothetical protein